LFDGHNDVPCDSVPASTDRGGELNVEV